jgi:hypothetical protein
MAFKVRGRGECKIMYPVWVFEELRGCSGSLRKTG